MRQVQAYALVSKMQTRCKLRAHGRALKKRHVVPQTQTEWFCGPHASSLRVSAGNTCAHIMHAFKHTRIINAHAHTHTHTHTHTQIHSCIHVCVCVCVCNCLDNCRAVHGNHRGILPYMYPHTIMYLSSYCIIAGLFKAPFICGPYCKQVMHA